MTMLYKIYKIMYIPLNWVLFRKF